MRLTTILVVLFSCLVLIISGKISHRNLHAGSQPFLSKAKGQSISGHQRRPFLGRAILESVKERRRH